MIIGIVGGGQLGMMMAEEAIKLGHKVIGLDPNPNCSLSHFAEEIIVSDYNDKEAFRELVCKSNVVTYEFENVDLDMIEKFIEVIPQKSAGLKYSRNRLIEKEFANSLGIKTCNYKKLTNKNDIFIPSIIKTTTGGYDGKGQYLVVEKSDVDHIEIIDSIECIVEEKIDFDYEISVVATRDISGNTVTFPIPTNSHKNGILHISEVYNTIEPRIEKVAIEYTEKIMSKLDYVGTLAVEYFVKDFDVIFNEFAPRPHNSGHYTIEGCNVSQFRNHILAITKEEVIKPTLVDKTVMINVLGQNDIYVERSKKYNSYHHDYFKIQKKHNRKMGHITILDSNISELKNIIEDITKE